jgi:hypothetical protein
VESGEAVRERILAGFIRSKYRKGDCGYDAIEQSTQEVAGTSHDLSDL